MKKIKNRTQETFQGSIGSVIISTLNSLLGIYKSEYAHSTKIISKHQDWFFKWRVRGTNMKERRVKSLQIKTNNPFKLPKDQGLIVN